MRNNINLIIFNNYIEDINNIFNKKIINKILNNGYIIDFQGNKVNFINTIVLFQVDNKKRIGLI